MLSYARRNYPNHNDPRKPTAGEQSRSRPSLLIRHRWLNELRFGYFRCVGTAAAIYDSYDLLCFGCGARIDWRDIDWPNRYRLTKSEASCSRWDRMLETIGVALDLRVAALTLEARARRWKS